MIHIFPGTRDFLAKVEYHCKESHLLGAGSSASTARRKFGRPWLAPFDHILWEPGKPSLGLNYMWMQDGLWKCLRRWGSPLGAAGDESAGERGKEHYVQNRGNRAGAPVWSLMIPTFVESVVSINGREFHWALNLSLLRWLRHVWAWLVNLMKKYIETIGDPFKTINADCVSLMH